MSLDNTWASVEEGLCPVSGSFYVLRKALGLTLLGAVTWARAVNILSLFLLQQNG